MNDLEQCGGATPKVRAATHDVLTRARAQPQPHLLTCRLDRRDPLASSSCSLSALAVSTQVGPSPSTTLVYLDLSLSQVDVPTASDKLLSHVRASPALPHSQRVRLRSL